MSDLPVPLLDPRDAAVVLSELLARRPAYLPEWGAAEGDLGRAVLEIFTRQMQTLIARLNRAPGKNRLAFLDALGINLIPADAARAPVVFQSIPGGGEGRARYRAGVRGRRHH